MVLQNNCDIAEQLWYCKFIFATLAKILKLSGLQKLVADPSLPSGRVVSVIGKEIKEDVEDVEGGFLKD